MTLMTRLCPLSLALNFKLFFRQEDVYWAHPHCPPTGQGTQGWRGGSTGTRSSASCLRPLLTWKPSRADSSWALLRCNIFPAFVTKTTGTRSCPWGSTSLRKASLAAGMTWWPRTSTPSMSNRNPKVGGLCTEGR